MRDNGKGFSEIKCSAERFHDLIMLVWGQGFLLLPGHIQYMKSGVTREFLQESDSKVASMMSKTIPNLPDISCYNDSEKEYFL